MDNRNYKTNFYCPNFYLLFMIAGLFRFVFVAEKRNNEHQLFSERIFQLLNLIDQCGCGFVDADQVRTQAWEGREPSGAFRLPH